tara:strand:- start:1054 stop:1278 length:225 start_codon:yes stop_codon:yes gene_type:complete
MNRANKAQKRQEATERQEVRDTISNYQQIQRLNARLGEGVGAEKERDRLEYLIQEEEVSQSRRQHREKSNGNKN